jgi:TetR/AcrR family transcriptional repressor of nem operon
MAGRPRTYDEEEVLDRVRDLFWQNGYAGTSIADLSATTGLDRGSLYHAFGDKHTLFLKVLKRYQSARRSRYLQFFEVREDRNRAEPRNGKAGPNIQSIVDWLELATRDCLDPRKRGCLAFNTAMELSPHDPDFQKVMARHQSTMQSALAGYIDRGQKLGVFRADRPAGELAEFLFTLLSGITAHARIGVTNFESVIELARDALQPNSMIG